VPLHNVEDRIHAAQLTIPRCRFNSTKCEQGLAGLREYCRDWDDKQKVFKDNPKHNWASHPADAFGYMDGLEAGSEARTSTGAAIVQTIELNVLWRVRGRPRARHHMERDKNHSG
jgi:hypothetical protein